MIMKKKIGRGRLYDILHRGGVITLVAVTGLSVVQLAFVVYHQFTTPKSENKLSIAVENINQQEI